MHKHTRLEGFGGFIESPIRSADLQPLELCRIRVSIGILNGALTIKFSAGTFSLFFILVDPISSPLPHFIDNLCRQFPLPHLYFFLLFLCLGLSTVFQQFFFGELKSSRTWKQVESITWLRLEDFQVQVLLTLTIPHCYSIKYWSDLVLITSFFE